MGTGKIRVPVAGSIGKAVFPNTAAGARIGTNLQLPDGSTPSLAQLAAALGVSTAQAQTFTNTLWRLILEIPPNVVQVAKLTGTGLVERDPDGSWRTVPYPSPGQPGSEGEQGLDGERGPPGPVGAPGTVGLRGPPGEDGLPGDDGSQGPPGPTGPAGAGTTGAQGPQGNPGVDGDPGQDGDTGPPGSMGAQGPVGAIGTQGYRGPEGEPGMDGDNGAPGPAGPIGIPGPQGNPGADGDQGQDGDIGPPGATGVAGPVGGTGPAGPIGFGAEGEQGPDGDRGPPGPTGPAGANGAQGPIGSANYQIQFGDDSGGSDDSSGGHPLDIGASPTWGGLHTFATPTKFNAMITVNAVAASIGITVNSLNGSTTQTPDITIIRTTTTANVIEKGASLSMLDSGALTQSAIQHAGGQTEFWQFNAAAWTQWLTHSAAGATALNGPMSVNPVAASIGITVNSLNGSTTQAPDITIIRTTTTANVIEKGASISMFDSGATTQSAIQHAGGQTEFWQFNAAAWTQWLTRSATGVVTFSGPAATQNIWTFASGSTTGTQDMNIMRTATTANSVGNGPNIVLQDSTANTNSMIQQSGGQTEFWQFNGAWRQWLVSQAGGTIVYNASAGTSHLFQINGGACLTMVATTGVTIAGGPWRFDVAGGTGGGSSGLEVHATTTTTAATNTGGSAPPALAKYLSFVLNGVTAKIPYYL